MQTRFRELTLIVDVNPQDKSRLKAFMNQELSYYNNLVEGLGSRARTFPETLLALHKDWENLWLALAMDGNGIKQYYRAKEDAELPEILEPHRKMLLGKSANGARFLDERMFNIMSIAAAPAALHPLVRKFMAQQALEFYKDQAGKLIKRNDQAYDNEDLYSKPIDLLVKRDIVSKRHLQIPRSALNAIYYYEKVDETHIFHPYSENPIVVEGYDLEHNNHWNQIVLHQQPGIEAVSSTPWVIDVKNTMVPYNLKFVDVESPKTGRLFSIAKSRY